MTLFAGPDDFAERVRESGMNAEQYAVQQHRERAKRLWKPSNAVRDTEIDDLEARMNRRVALYEQRLEKLQADNEKKLTAAYRKIFWRMSWLEMCRLAKIANDLKSQSVDVVENNADHAGIQRKFARDIMREVCEKHGISKRNFISHRRWQNLVDARMEFYWRCREETVLSYPQIGKICGGRDHTTILYGARQHQKRVDAGEV